VQKTTIESGQKELDVSHLKGTDALLVTNTKVQIKSLKKAHFMNSFLQFENSTRNFTLQEKYNHHPYFTISLSAISSNNFK